MNIYIFGNEDLRYDNAAILAARKMHELIPGINFVTVLPNQDLPFTDKDHVVLMDTMKGIDEIKVVDERKLDALILPPRATVHDFDLGFQLKYLKKIGKIKHITIICIPQEASVDYNTLQSILRKLVAQDMQGS